MTFNDYQIVVGSILKEPERGDLKLLCGQLCSESGEVFGALTKITRAIYKDEDTGKLWEKLDKELGDTLFYLAAICSYRNMTLGELSSANIKKLKARLKAGTLTSGSGDDR
jgi:NTP pyrophosphatase (non-canonical NTP hydrolase)